MCVSIIVFKHSPKNGVCVCVKERAAKQLLTMIIMILSIKQISKNPRSSKSTMIARPIIPMQDKMQQMHLKMCWEEQYRNRKGWDFHDHIFRP